MVIIIFTKIIGKIKSKLTLLGKYCIGLKILFSERKYERLDEISINKDLVDDLWRDDSILCKLLSENTNAVKDAERLLNYEFKIFDKTVLFHDKKIEWHKDFYSSEYFAVKPISWIKIVPNKNKDIIVPWELSRLQFIPTIIQAYRETKNKLYLDFFLDVLDDWINGNPYKMGVNWITPMDAGIRVLNMFLGISFFYEYIPKVKREFYLKIINAHLRYIYEDDLKDIKEFRHNHFLISTSCLSTVSHFFKGGDIPKYYECSTSALNKEILRQFNEEGVNFEYANHYHQLSIESILINSLMHEKSTLYKNDGIDSEDILLRINKAVGYVSSYMKCFGQSPQFGDSCDGRILSYKDYFDCDPLDHKFIVDVYGFSFKSKEFNNQLNRNYLESGYGCYKYDNFGLCINNANNSLVDYTGHSHCDKGSFVLRVKGTPLFIDSGTYCYTSNVMKRNKFRNSFSHNIIKPKGEEQFLLDNKSAFSRFKGFCVRISNESIKDETLIKINGILHNRYNYQREFKLSNDTIEIIDSIEDKENRLAQIIFNIHPNIRFKYSSEHSVIDFFLNNVKICHMTVDKNLKIKSEKSYYSKAYMEIEESRLIVLESSDCNKEQFINNLIIN